jgi:hypothetical protein
MVKIAFSGKCTSGKSTSAKLVKKSEPKTIIFSFAKKIYDLAYELFDMKENEKDRDLLINIGKKMREINEGVWLDYIVKQSKDTDNVVIDDLRFPNEFTKLREEGFILVRLHVSTETQIRRLTELYPTTWKEQLEKLGDYSEIALDNHDFDYTINTENFNEIHDFINKMNG